MVTPLDPQDAFLNGRTEAVRAQCQGEQTKAFTTTILRPCTLTSTRTASTRSGIPSFTRNLPAGRPKNAPESSAAICMGWSNAASCLLTICFIPSYRSAWLTSCCFPCASNAPDTKCPCPERNAPTSATTPLANGPSWGPGARPN